MEATKEMLFADLRYFGESEWRNEEIGEKRFNFFLTLVTGIEGGLGALWAAEKGLDPQHMATIVAWANLGLLVFGVMTYLRMRHRDAVTDEYRSTQRYIRATFRSIFDRGDRILDDYHVPVGLKGSTHHIRPKPAINVKDRKKGAKPLWQRLRKLRERYTRVMQGGYTHTTAVVNGVVLTIALVGFSGVEKIVDSPDKFHILIRVWPSAIFGLVLTATLWTIPKKKANERFPRARGVSN
jgi:hypothetical protein